MTAATQPHPIPAGCTTQEARALTDQIKGSVERTWGLLIAAYERQAWKALDYTSWQSYVTAEFGISRSRSYQLLDQAQVVREVASAAGVHKVDITEATARDVKPHLAQVTEQVREAVADLPEADRPSVAAQVVADAREQFNADRATGEVLSSDEWTARNIASDAPAGEGAPAPSSPAGSDPWSPSASLDRPPPGSSKPTKSTRPASLDELFRDAALDLRKAVNRLEQISSDGRLPVYAKKLVDKHCVGLDDAVEGIGLVLTRLHDAAPGAKS